MAMHIETHEKWKTLSLDPKYQNKEGFENLICIKELSNYKVVSSGTKSRGAEDKSKTKQGKQIKKKIEKQNITDQQKNQEESNSVKKKKKPRKKRRKSKAEKDSLKPSTVAKTKQTSNPQSKSKISEKKKGFVVQGDDIIDIRNDNAVDNRQGKNKKRKLSDTQKKHDIVTNKKLKRKSPSEQKSKKALCKDGNKGQSDEDEVDVVPKKKRKAMSEQRLEEFSGQEYSKDDNSAEADMSNWKNLFVPPPVIKALSEQGFVSPTPIQALTLPSAIRDKMDIVGAAETGSGKTLAFGIPLIHHILRFQEQEAKNAASMRKKGKTQEENESDYEDSESDDGEDKLSSDNESMDSAEDEIEVVDLPGVEGLDDEFDSDDEGEYDLAPEEEEELEPIEETELGCVYVKNDVEFDWLKKKTGQSEQPLLALILTPTRELAIQVRNHLVVATKYTDIKIAAIVGGMAQQKQERLLKKCPEIVVATPGRLWELIEEGEPHLAKVKKIQHLVIDEADRMIEKGHFKEVTALLDHINKDSKRQTLVFSATLTLVHSGPQRLMTGKKKFKMDQKQKLELLMEKIGVKAKPKIVDLTRKAGTVETLTEARITCSAEEKDYYMYYFLVQYPGRTLVFSNSKDCIRRLVSVFTLLRCSPLALHADMHQKQRLKNLEKFKGDKRGLLLATDVAARGLDIPNVEHVIHYQVPKSSENYVHRSGRTARASKEGLSVMLVGPEDLKDYRKIIKTLNRDEELPQFPVEAAHFPGIKARVNLSRHIDKEEHRLTRQKAQNNWFEKAARDGDIEIDDENLLNCMGDEREQAQTRRRLGHFKEQLNELFMEPLTQTRYSGKYPTKEGRLTIPYLTDATLGCAVKKVKEEKQLFKTSHQALRGFKNKQKRKSFKKGKKGKRSKT